MHAYVCLYVCMYVTELVKTTGHIATKLRMPTKHSPGKVLKLYWIFTLIKSDGFRNSHTKISCCLGNELEKGQLKRPNVCPNEWTKKAYSKSFPFFKKEWEKPGQRLTWPTQKTDKQQKIFHWLWRSLWHLNQAIHKNFKPICIYATELVENHGM